MSWVHSSGPEVSDPKGVDLPADTLPHDRRHLSPLTIWNAAGIEPAAGH